MQLESHDFDIVCDIGRVAEDGAQNCRSQNTDRLSAVFRLPKHVAKLRAFFKTEGGPQHACALFRDDSPVRAHAHRTPWLSVSS